MSENVVTLSRTELQTQTVLWRDIHSKAYKALQAFGRCGDGDGMLSAKKVMLIASGELRKLEGVR